MQERMYIGSEALHQLKKKSPWSMVLWDLPPLERSGGERSKKFSEKQGKKDWGSRPSAACRAMHSQPAYQGKHFIVVQVHHINNQGDFA